MAACGHGLANAQGDISILEPGGPMRLPLVAEGQCETEPRFERSYDCVSKYTSTWQWSIDGNLCSSTGSTYSMVLFVAGNFGSMSRVKLYCDITNNTQDIRNAMTMEWGIVVHFNWGITLSGYNMGSHSKGREAYCGSVPQNINVDFLDDQIKS